jgi:hypothetical protein
MNIDHELAQRDAAAGLMGCAHEQDAVRRQLDRAVFSRAPRRAASEWMTACVCQSSVHELGNNVIAFCSGTART